MAETRRKTTRDQLFDLTRSLMDTTSDMLDLVEDRHHPSGYSMSLDQLHIAAHLHNIRADIEDLRTCVEERLR